MASAKRWGGIGVAADDILQGVLNSKRIGVYRCSQICSSKLHVYRKKDGGRQLSHRHVDIWKPQR